MLLKYQQADPSRQIAVGLIDAALIIGLVSFITISTFQFPGIAREISGYNSSLIVIVAFVLYRIFSILLFDRTLGMWILHVVFRNAREEQLSFSEKLLASFFILYKGVEYYYVIKQKPLTDSSL